MKQFDWHSVRWSFWFGVLAFIVIMLGLIWSGLKVYQTLMDEQQVPLGAIVIQGDMQHSTSDDIRQALIAGEVGSFFAADVETLRDRVEALPWIYSASVRKEWPGRLRIFVVEQIPMAIWNDQQVLNKQGQIFSAQVNELAVELPHLKGPDADVQEVIRQFERIGGMLALSPFSIQQLEVTERFSVSVRLNNGISLRLGREARLERVQRFMDLYSFLSTQDERAIDYVDLRYDTGVAVGWRE
ncbi:cell division protein DivIVA [Aliidiomarina minuta]|uniref:Cell division protein FtsQ n=1 Tax=Aliidiomarina minuta TaxID=880057 RepID=A0A432W8Y5_9GAMM|nr:cell division protein FtsQ/DivIB [Aliidiomarina minuta]RUO26617.1 cell division protein DivIVA [Aliidiomarina minuta]